jgi:hypothetical protein
MEEKNADPRINIWIGSLFDPSKDSKMEVQIQKTG